MVTLVGTVLAATAAFASAPGASATTRYVVHKTRYRSAVVSVDARVHRTASATETATVGGFTATATGSGQATQVVTARARARGVGHGTGAATHRADAQRKAISRAIRRARQDAQRTAQARAARAAHARAASRALARASARARADAQRAATDRAAAMAAAAPPSQGSSPPGELTGGNPPVTIGDTGSGGTSGGGLPVSVGVGPCGGETPTKADGTAWTCSFDDEFDGTSLDSAKWTVQLTSISGFNQNGACYVNTPDTISVAGGMLDLSVVKAATPFTCASPRGDYTTDYAAGEITTLNTFSQTYGRFEVRARLPAATVAGLQETFWLWPLDQSVYGSWPRAGEIDFGEFYSQYADWVIPYLHYTYDKTTVDWNTNVNVVTALPAPYNQPGMNCRIDPSAFNTYTLTWAPGQLRIAVNGQDCIVDNYRPLDLASPAPFDQPFFLALTQAVGIGSNAPTAATPFPATTQVDYVRAWK